MGGPLFYCDESSGPNTSERAVLILRPVRRKGPTVPSSLPTSAISPRVQQAWDKCQDLSEHLDQVTRNFHDKTTRREAVERSFAEQREK